VKAVDDLLDQHAGVTTQLRFELNEPVIDAFEVPLDTSKDPAGNGLDAPTPQQCGIIDTFHHPRRRGHP
jgi:hypothetical protein